MIKISRKNIGVFIDHDIMIRHFVSSSVLESLEKNHNLFYVFPGNSKRVRTNPESLKLKNIHLIDIDEKRSTALRRYCHMLGVRTRSVRHGKDRQSTIEFYKHIFRWPPGNYYIVVLLTSWVFFPIFRRYKARRLGSNNALEKVVEELELDMIVHPTVLDGLFINDLIKIGKEQKIPTILLMNSWDNPSGKALMLDTPDRLLVWGEQTKQHSIDYLGLEASKVVISGAAQFEVYRNQPSMSKERYRSLLGLNGNTILVCYAGSSKGLNEMNHCRLLDNAIRETSVDIHVVYRPHPWKALHSTEKPFWEYNFTKVSLDPLIEENYIELLNNRRFRTELVGYEATNVVLKSIDCLISPLSTILLEASMLGIPIGVYLSDDDLGEQSHLGRAARRIQFTEFFERVKPLLCYSEKELWSTVEKLVNLSQNESYRVSLKQSIEHFVTLDSRPYSQTLLDVVTEFD